MRAMAAAAAVVLFGACESPCVEGSPCAHVYPNANNGGVTGTGSGVGATATGGNAASSSAGGASTSGGAGTTGGNAGSTGGEGTTGTPTSATWVCLPVPLSDPEQDVCAVFDDPLCLVSPGSPACNSQPDGQGVPTQTLALWDTYCSPMLPAEPQCRTQLSRRMSGCIYSYLFGDCREESVFLPCAPCRLPDGGFSQDPDDGGESDDDGGGDGG
jgi:hypothetical protein